MIDEILDLSNIYGEIDVVKFNKSVIWSVLPKLKTSLKTEIDAIKANKIGK